MRTPLVALALLAAGTAPGFAAAQAPRPLDKVEVIRLLTNPLFAQSEVADVVRRSCVGFRPTERDWADLRNAGASGEVIASVAACTARHSAELAAAPSAPPAALTAVAVTSEVVAVAGSPASVRVFVHRGGVPQRRVPLTLRGTTAVGLQRDARAVTDDSGMAVFPLPPVGQPGTHRFEVLGNSGSTFPGRPSVSFVVRPGEPGRLRVTPDYIASIERGVSIVATVTDSLGNPLGQEPVELNSGVGAPMSAATDSLGRASFALAAGALPRGGALQLRVRKLAAVDVPVADAAGLSGAATGFAAPAARRGRVGSSLSEPLVFQARTVQGSAPIGRVVRFRAVNARIKPDSVVLDSTGRVPLDVVLGTRAGEALVFATIDSVEKLLTFQVDAGPIATLVIERNGEVVTGREIVVRVAAPFVLRVTARDFYGNETSIDALAQMLRANRPQLAARQRYLEIVALEPGDAAVLVTLKAQRIGTFDFTIGSGITASVRVEAVAR
jgi:hypothetical protein